MECSVLFKATPDRSLLARSHPTARSEPPAFCHLESFVARASPEARRRLPLRASRPLSLGAPFPPPPRALSLPLPARSPTWYSKGMRAKFWMVFSRSQTLRWKCRGQQLAGCSSDPTTMVGQMRFGANAHVGTHLGDRSR
ncbi:hypothetical protein GUJ93_ZPchr0003g17663 [Zizania palustris]|uniref:Uncharacterized protein n=1 Tax=Zizania palustris TaxID=103762 RepID=A0A8J5VXK8_ZIZPA|nr:hypothetical protein GUJ93_ZPchr0003g17663 [Zizania palustris]